MIAKAIKGTGFRGALEYDLSKEKGPVLDTNMEGSTPRELAKEFGEIRKLRPNVGKAVLHVSLSAAPGEHLSDDQWREVGRRYLQHMALKDNQYIITRHTDTDHEHVHLLVNRVQFDGQVTSDSHDYRRQEVLMRELERELSLQPVQPSIEAQRHAATKGEIEEGLRTGVPSTRQRLQQLCDGAAKDSRSFTEYEGRLAAAGVELVPVTQLDDTKLSGLSYRLDGVLMKGSDLGKAYSPMGLAKRGVSYEKDRDLAAVSCCHERESARRIEPIDRDPSPVQNHERGRTGVDPGAARAGDGRTDGRDAHNVDRDFRRGEAAQRTDDAADYQRDEGVPQRGGPGGGRTESPERGGTPAGVDPLSAGAGDRMRDSGPRERILALAAPTNRIEPVGRTSGGRVPATRDRSLEAVERQIAALGVTRFDVAIRHVDTGKTEMRVWDKSQLVDSVAWLKRMNARSHDVFVRPHGEHGLVLVDGLMPENLRSMRDKGLTPAASLEISKGHYQAWVKMSEHPVDSQIRNILVTEISSYFATAGERDTFDGFGRLAGFTNQEVSSRHDQRPFVLIQSSMGTVAESARGLLEQITRLRSVEQNRAKQVERFAHKDQGRGHTR